MAGYMQTDWLMRELGASTVTCFGVTISGDCGYSLVFEYDDSPHECDVIQRMSEAWRNLEK